MSVHCIGARVQTVKLMVSAVRQENITSTSRMGKLKRGFQSGLLQETKLIMRMRPTYFSTWTMAKLKALSEKSREVH